MTTTLSVAAGGGGDALAALIADRVLNPGSSEQIVASFSWDRYILDPTPGPRTIQDFEGLVQHTRHVWEVTATSQLRTGGISGLAILAQHTEGRFFLLDPSRGADGIREQLADLAALASASSVTLVDVGGDIAASGLEPELSSPLADSLALAAVAGLSLPGQVVVGGPGLDGELSGDYVRARMARAGATNRRVTSPDVKAYVSVLDRHPSEATALLSAAALGIEGQAEIRDSAALVPLDAASADLLLADCRAVLAINQVAQALAGSRSFTEAEHATREICGRTELDHERRKAATLTRTAYRAPTATELQDRITAHRLRAVERGATLTSLRRLGEVAGLRTYEPKLIRAAAGDLAYDDVPLCRL
ncbi:DUF1152 domain-containing protein [Couchioplanes caeruleus]|uniref:DUF1152 domain-containing protein n=1 Tax=Couchioplanes caeruleus TaxID=56438 RepID=UPI001472CF5E|nr:DUF1152 domain-containing protein [Couchioplanes caeruleus]